MRRVPRGQGALDLAIAVLVVAFCAAWPALARAESVASALDRPALMVNHPERTTLLGAAQAGARLVAVGERGIVIVSDDAGARWRQVPVPASVTLTAVRFADAMHGFAVGHGGVVLASADGGLTWARRLDGRQAAQLALDAARADGDAKAIKQAERLVADGADKPFLDLHFSDANHGIVVGAYNLAFTTADGGSHWQSVMARLDNPKALHLYALRARGEALLIAGEQGLVLRSDDKGRSFRRLAVPYKGSFFTAELPSADGREMVVAGLRGNVWHSGDAGESWAASVVPMPASITGSALLPGRAGGSIPATVFVNQAGQVLRGRGDAVTASAGTPLPPLTGVLPLAGGDLLILGVAGVSVQAATETGAPK